MAQAHWVMPNPPMKCRCGNWLLTQRNIQTGKCLVCLEVALSRALIQHAQPSKWRNWRN